MSTGIEIKQIKNQALRNLADEVDTSHKKDGYIDSSELSVFTSKANELPKGSYSEEDFAQVMGLFRSQSVEKTERASLSWGEIGKSALKSVGSFFKGMFCDEEGFSLSRTLTTVGTIGLLAGAAPIAAALGAAPAVVGGIALGAKVIGTGLAGYMALDGGVKLIKGTSKYYDAKTHEEAQQAMDEAMEGGVETAFSLPALFGIFKANNKAVKASKGTKGEPAKVSETKITDGVEITQGTNNGINWKTETTYKNGKPIKEVCKKSNGVTEEIIYDENLKAVSKKTSSEGMIEEEFFDTTKGSQYQNYLSKKKITYSNGKVIETTYKDSWEQGLYSKPSDILSKYEKFTDKQGRIVERFFDGEAGTEKCTIDGKIEWTTRRTSDRFVRKNKSGKITYEETYYKNGKIKTRDFKEGSNASGYVKEEYVYDNFGNEVKKVLTDKNGKTITREISVTEDGYRNIKYTYEKGVTENNRSSLAEYPEGGVKEITYEHEVYGRTGIKGKLLRKEVHKDLNGNTISTEVTYDGTKELKYKEMSNPDREGRIRIEMNEQGTEYTETYSDGRKKTYKVKRENGKVSLEF